MNFIKLSIICALCLGLVACQSAPDTVTTLPGYIPKEVAKKVHIGKPYRIKGKKYYPSYNPDYEETGIASWYGPGFHGKKTANGEIYDQYAMTAAHTTLPIPSLVRVTNLKNGQTIVVRINDRGPFAPGRIIDLSKRAAETIGIAGIEKVRVTYLKEETEQYWADGNFRSKTIPVLASKRPAAKRDVFIEKERAVDASPAPIMSVNSTQVSRLDNNSAIKTVAIDQQQQTPPADVPPWNQPLVQQSSGSSRHELKHTGPIDLSREDVFVPSPATTSTMGYFIQAGAFASQPNAARLVSRLSHIGHAFTENIQRSSGTLHRVRVGPYASYGEASNFLHELFRMGIKDATVVAVK